MSDATDAILQALHFDRQAATFSFDASVGRLGASRDALRAAFGEARVELTDAELLPPPPPGPGVTETLALHGVADLFGHHSRELYMEWGLAGGEVKTLLLLVPLPEKQWKLATGFPAVASAPLLADLQVRGGVLVVSYGLRRVAGSRTVIELDRAPASDATGDGADRVTRQIDLSPFDLQDGLQLLADGLVNGSAVLGDLRSHAGAAGPHPDTLPPPDSEPARVTMHGDVAAGWLQLEGWWDDVPALPGLPETGAHRAALAVRYNLTEPDKSYHFWLREIGTPADPIVLEAYSIEGFTPRYSTPAGARTPLGESLPALGMLLHEPSLLVEMLPSRALPDTLSLLGLTYSPGHSLLLTVGAGDHEAAQGYLLQLGPFTLSEVDITLAIPLGDEKGTPIVELTGYLAVAGERFQVHVRAWDLIEGALDEPEGAHLGQFIERELGFQLPFGLDTVTLRHASLQRVLPGSHDGEATTTLRIKLDGKVELLPRAILLDAITLDAHMPDGGPLLGSLSADLTMGPLALFAQAERTADGWRFEAMADAPPGGISLTALVDHLVDSLGAAVPHGVPDVALERIALSYDTAAGTLDIQAITDWTFDSDVPILGGSHSKAIVQLTVTRDPQSRQKHATFFVDWTLERPVGDADKTISLEAQATLSAQAQSFSVELEVPEGHQHFSELMQVVHVPDVIPHQVEGVLDAIVQVESLSLDFARPGNALDIAWTRALGPGSLLMEINRASGAPDDQGDGAGSRAVKVSWVGKEETSTLGLADVLDLLGEKGLWDTIHDLPLVGDMITEMLTFRQLGFTWEEQDAEHSTLTLMALSTYRSGTEAFIALSRGANRGVVAGVAFARSGLDGASPDLPPMLSGNMGDTVQLLLAAAKTVLSHIELTHLLISTVSSKQYQPPAFAPAAMLPSTGQADATAPTFPFGSGAMQLDKGLSVGARLALGKDDLVRKVLDVDEIDGQVVIGPDKIALQVSIPKTLKLDAGGGNKLALTAPVLEIAEVKGEPEVKIQGSLDLQLLGQRLDASAWLTLSETSLQGHVQLREMSLLDHQVLIPQLPGVMLVIDPAHPLSFELGLDFEPPGFDMGLQASFAIYKDDKDQVTGSGALVLELVEEVPQPQYVSFEIDELSIPVLLEALTGVQYWTHKADKAAKGVATAAETIEGSAGALSDVAGSDVGDAVQTASEAADKAAKAASAALEAFSAALGHVEAILSSVELTAVRLHWADTLVDLPDGTVVQPGVGFRGALRIFDWAAFAMLDLAAPGAGGISGHFEAEKIELGGVLRIWGDGKGIRTAPETAAAIATAAPPDAPADATSAPPDPAAPAGGSSAAPTPPPIGAASDGWIIEPGGPVLHFSTEASPFLHANLHAELFGVLQTDIQADITDEGFAFLFHLGAGADASAELECHWWHKEGKLEAHGDMVLHLHGRVGPLIPDVEATALELDVDVDTHVQLLVDSKEFKFNVHGSFDFEGHSLVIPELTIDVRFSTVAELLSHLWDHVVAEAEHIFADVIADLRKAIADAAEEVATVPLKAADESAAITSKALGEAATITDSAAQGMDHAAQEQASEAQALHERAAALLAGAADDARAAASPYSSRAETLDERARQVEAETTAIVEAMALEVDAQVKEVEAEVAKLGAEVTHEVSQLLQRAHEWVDAERAKARAFADQLKREADQIVQSIEDEISRLEDAAEDEIVSGYDVVTQGAVTVADTITPAHWL